MVPLHSSLEEPGAIIPEKAVEPLDLTEEPLPASTPGEPCAEPDAGHVPADTLFEAVLERGSAQQGLGLRLQTSDGITLCIEAVVGSLSSPALIHNAQAEPKRRLLPGVAIIDVNGVGGRDVLKKVEEIKANPRLHLRCRRPTVVRPSIPKRGERVGLVLQCNPGGRMMTVGSVLDGAVKSSAADVRPGDHIVQVCGQDGTSEELTKLMHSADPVEFTIYRFPEVTEAYAQGFLPQTAAGGGAEELT